MGDEADYLTDGEDYYDFFYGCYEEDEFESEEKEREDMCRNIIDELSEKVEKLEHEKRALENRCYALTRGLFCNFCAVDGCRYKVKEQKDD